MRLIDSVDNTADYHHDRQVSKSTKYDNLEALTFAVSSHDFFCVQFIDDGEELFEKTNDKLHSLGVDTTTRVIEVRNEGLCETSYAIAFQGRKSLISALNGVREYFAIYAALKDGKLVSSKPIYENSQLIRTLCA